MRLVYGVGINDKKYPSVKDGESIKEYTLWRSMLTRCFSQKTQIRQPTYKGCTVSENFKSYSYFYEWCQNQIGFNLDGWNLDKDLLIKGNKIYSEDNCVFLPSIINGALIKRDSARGEYPIGVSFDKINNKFKVVARVNGRLKAIGYFGTVDLAFQAYKHAKENHIKLLAEKYRDQIYPRAYEALLNYKVEITD